MRPIDADALKEEVWKAFPHFLERLQMAPVFALIREAPTVDAAPVTHCKDCKHRPSFKKPAKYKTGFDLYFPDEECPCQCDDGYYSWYPEDNWFCANGERKEE